MLRCLMSLATPTTVIHCGGWSLRGRPNMNRPPIGSRPSQKALTIASLTIATRGRVATSSADRSRPATIGICIVVA
jgi:hypothetical protein